MGRLGGWISFLLPLLIYIVTLDPSASWWDCPEYILTAYRLEIGHSPGNPSWSLAANVAAHVGELFGKGWIAYAVNLTSALFTSLAILLIYKIALFMVRTAFRGSRVADPLPASLSALSGALLFAFSDSVWFSAVESEVYALSLLFTAWTLLCMLRFTLSPRSPKGKRHLILTAYLLGLSIGVHELNLLAIPACGLLWLFARRHRPAVGKAWLTLLLSIALLGAILLVLYPGLPTMAAFTELFAVNTLHLPFHSGAILFLLLLLAVIIILPLLAQRFCRPLVTPLWCLSLLIVGFSSYILIPIRGVANPPVNENAPTDLFSFIGYLKRDQYGSRPLFYDATPYSRPMLRETIDSAGVTHYPEIVKIPKRRVFAPAIPAGHLSYRTGLHTEDERMRNEEWLKDAANGEHRYILADYRYDPVYTPELNMFFPRLTSTKEFDIKNYESWAGMTRENMTLVECSYALDSSGRAVGKMGVDGKRIKETLPRPTYLQHLREMFGYQIGYMYFRYLLWNFCGRQNDYPSAGEIEHGNMISGIPLIDNAIYGETPPDEIGRHNPGRNVYFGLPLIAGILGAAILQRRRRRMAGWGAMTGRRWNAVILTLFLMTGVAIVVYLNQDPGEPRERDYSFLGSFMAFSLWITAGIAGGINRIMRSRWGRGWKCAAAGGLLLLFPGMMVGVNFDDHDRSFRSGPADYAANLLNSLDKDAILFVEGDNYTFPLWYAQEVEGVRRDVRVINLSYLATSWYVEQLMIPGEMSRKVELTAPRERIIYGAFNSVGIPREGPDTLTSVDAVEALRELYASDARRPGFRDVRLRFLTPQGDSLTLSLPGMLNGARSAGMRELAIIDIIATNGKSSRPRPVYWQQQVVTPHFAGFRPYAARTLFALKWTGQEGSDTTYLTDEGMRIFPRLRTGGADKRGMYADPYVGDQISRQRLSLLRLAKALTAEGRNHEALRVAKFILERYPDSVWSYQGMIASPGEVWQEGIELGELLRENGKATGDRESIALGDSLLRAQKGRQQEWQRWHNGLAPWQRTSLSPETRRLLPR